MPSIIYDFDALREAANLLEGADLPMNTVQPMAVEVHTLTIDELPIGAMAAEGLPDYSHFYGDCAVGAPLGTDPGC